MIQLEQIKFELEGIEKDIKELGVSL